MSGTVQIHGHPISQPTRSLISFCDLSLIPNAFLEVDIKNFGFLSPDFTKLNPFQTIPTIVHEDYTLWESGAIVTYLAETFDVDNQWYPKDLKTRARINSYLHWHHEGTRLPLHGYIRPKFTLPKYYAGPELSADAEVPLRIRFEGFFETLKWMIRDTGFVARTQEPSVADIFVYSEVAQSWFINYDLGEFKEVKVWFDLIGSIKEVSQAHEGLAKAVNDF